MFQSSKNSNPYHVTEKENGNRKKTHKKKYNPPRRKSHSRHSNSKKEKKWEAKLGNSHIKQFRYASDCIGPERLTKHMGFLAKGKISDSISRLEKIMPEKLKTRAKRDLDKVLELDNNCSAKQMLITDLETISSGEENNSSPSIAENSATPGQGFVLSKIREQHNHHQSAENAPPKCFSSDKYLDDDSPSRYDEISFCQEIITKRLHCQIESTNKRLFSGVSCENKLKRELLAIKSQYNLSRKTISNSSNGESSQDTCNDPSIIDLTTDNFELHPVLTQETAVPKDLENMFPSSQDTSSQSEDETYTNLPNLLHQSNSNNQLLLSTHLPRNDCPPSSENKDSLTLIRASPISSSGSPVWVPDVSPIKFFPHCRPTPKLYFRQKMF